MPRTRTSAAQLEGVQLVRRGSCDGTSVALNDLMYTILIVLLVLFLLGGGGFYLRGRR